MHWQLATYATFLAADPRRELGALELGHNLTAEVNLWRACWYEATGEITVEKIDDASAIKATDFYAGISGPVSVLGTVSSRQELESKLGAWPGLERWRPRTPERLDELLGS